MMTHYELLISVLMLREGLIKIIICVTVVFRATEADLLLEQIVGPRVEADVSPL